MPDEHMDSIEPYDYSELKPFSTAYLPGFLADKFDVTAEDSRQRADSRCAGTLRSALEKTVSGYETCSARESNTTIKRGKVHYALMPVWMLNTEMARQGLPFCHERTDRKARGRPACG